jgi:hypothetical protein
MSLNVDLTPLWDSISNYFPIFFGVLVIPAGIAIAIKLSEFLISKVRDAFK